MFYFEALASTSSTSFLQMIARADVARSGPEIAIQTALAALLSH